MAGIVTRIAVAGVIGCAAAVVPSASATAADGPEGIASGWIGEVDVVVDGEEIVQEPIAPCDIVGTGHNSAGRINLGDVADFWGGETDCRKDDSAHADVTGRYFATDVLREWGGPRIRMSGFGANCHTLDNGSAGGMRVRGLRGIEIPEEIPPNYTVTVPGRIEGAVPLAKVVLNEIIVPDPPDGSMTLNAMRIELFPEGGPNSGEIVIGTVNCDPYGVSP